MPVNHKLAWGERMKYFRYAHLVYAAFFTLCALTVLRLGSGPGFHIVLKAVLAMWLVSAVGLTFRRQWAWFGSVASVALVWLLLALNLAVAIRTDPGHSDYAQELIMFTVFFFLPVTASLFGLWRTRMNFWHQSESRGMPATTCTRLQ